jgi:1-deoxy-D-xylulose-5-phosphate synthase
MYIEKINSPKDLKFLSVEQLNVVADEVRQGVLNRVSHHGGHVGPNLGFTEATVALQPEDKIVFDVSQFRAILTRCSPEEKTASST